MCAFSPEGHGVLVTWLSVCLVGTGSFLIASSCTAQSQTGLAGCDRDLVFLHSKWFNVLIVAVIGGFFTAFQVCVGNSGAACGRAATRSFLVVGISFASAVCTSIYAHFVHETFSETPSAPTPGHPVCVICLQGRNNLYSTIIWVGVLSAWLGWCIVSYTTHTHHAEVDRELTRRLNDEPNDVASRRAVVVDGESVC